MRIILLPGENQHAGDVDHNMREYNGERGGYASSCVTICELVSVVLNLESKTVKSVLLMTL